MSTYSTGSLENAIKILFGGKGWYYYRNVMGSLPVIGSVYTSMDRLAYMEDYMANRGLDWSNIQYPTMTMGYQGVSGLTNFVSSNIERLYK